MQTNFPQPRNIIPLGQGTTIFAMDAVIAASVRRPNWRRIAVMGACGVFHLVWIVALAQRIF